MIDLKLCDISDADFLLKLRRENGRYLNNPNINLSIQEEWLTNYKLREGEGVEFYFLIQEGSSSIGCVRLYDIDYKKRSFTFGSFIVDKVLSKNKYNPVFAMLQVFDFAFNDLNLSNCYFDCRKENLRGNDFYQKFGIKKIGENDLDILYCYNREDHKKRKDKIVKDLEIKMSSNSKIEFKKIIGKKIDLKFVEEGDEEFIARLRSQKGKFLSRSSNLPSDQLLWIRKYKERERLGEEYYFIIYDKSQKRIGTIRVYNISDSINTFCWGSWLVLDSAPSYAAIESAILIYNFAFNILKKDKAIFDVRKENKSVVRFHKNFGARVIKSDDLNYYFEFTSDDFKLSKIKYKKYLND